MSDIPWNFNKYLILLKDFNGKQQIRNLIIMEAPFWVRVYDPLIKARNEYMGRQIRDARGQIEEIDLKK